VTPQEATNQAIPLSSHLMSSSLENLIIDDFIYTCENSLESSFGWSFIDEFSHYLNVESMALKAFDLAKEILKKSMHENVIGTLSCGLIEDLLRHNYPKIFNEIISLAKSNVAWLEILKLIYYIECPALKAIQNAFPDLSFHIVSSS
jgi:hypothetical protein